MGRTQELFSIFPENYLVVSFTVVTFYPTKFFQSKNFEKLGSTAIGW